MVIVMRPTTKTMLSHLNNENNITKLLHFTNFYFSLTTDNNNYNVYFVLLTLFVPIDFTVVGMFFILTISS